MTIKNRLSVLENRVPSPANPYEGHVKLLEAIETVASRLRDGSFEDRIDASPIERVALAFERGDVTMAHKLVEKAAGRTER